MLITLSFLQNILVSGTKKGINEKRLSEKKLTSSLPFVIGRHLHSPLRSCVAAVIQNGAHSVSTLL